MATFEKAPTEVERMARQIIREDYPSIQDAEVTIDFIFAHADLDKNDKPKGPPLKWRGLVARGVCRPTKLKERVMGRADVEITLDGDWWKDEAVSDRERLALLAHEIHHISLKGDTDDHGRPKIEMRDHDFEVGWFHAIAKKYGHWSFEVKQATKLFNEAGQYYWPDIYGIVEQKQPGRMALLETTPKS